MPFPDHYLILGVSEDASLETIKAAFRRLALKYHPDRNAGNAEVVELFASIQKAYEVLSHPEKRRAYDISRSGRQRANFPPAVAHTVADKNKIRIAVDKRVLRIDETLRVTVSVFVPDVAVVLGGVTHFEMQEEPVNVSFPPGKNMPEMEVSYLLKPSELGYIELGPASFIAHGTKYVSETLHIKVNPTPDMIVRRPVSRMEKFQGFTYVTLVTFYTILIAINIYHYKISPFIRSPQPLIPPGPVMLGSAQLATGAAPFEKYFGQGRRDKESLHRIVFHNGKSRDAVVLLMDAQTREPVRNNYIRAGDDLTMGNIPEGNYYLKAIFGNDWNETLCFLENKNICGGFNINARFENFQQEINVIKMQQSRSGDTLNYKIYEITLYPVQDGNAQSSEADAERFFNE